MESEVPEADSRSMNKELLPFDVATSEGREDSQDGVGCGENLPEISSLENLRLNAADTLSGGSDTSHDGDITHENNRKESGNGEMILNINVNDTRLKTFTETESPGSENIDFGEWSVFEQDAKDIEDRLCSINFSVSQEEYRESTDEESFCHFNLLPKELILLILSYFKPEDLSKRIAPVCKYWYTLAYDPCLWRTLDFDFNPNISSYHMCYIIKKIGYTRKIVIPQRKKLSVREVKLFTNFCTHLQELNVGFNKNLDEDMLNLIVLNCTNLERLNVEGCDHVDDDCACVISGAKNLKHLNFSHCSLSDDGVLALAMRLSKITSLNVDGISWITDRSIQTLCSLHHQTLEELDLDGAELTDDSMEAVSTCTNLRKLNVSFCELLTDTSLTYIQDLKKLRQLKLRRGENFTTVAICQLFSTDTLSCLVDLNLSECSNLLDEGLLQITKCCGGTLRRLSLCWCWDITDKGATSIVDNCGKLEFLELIGLKLVVGTCFGRVSEEMPNLTFLDLCQCNSIADDLIVDVVRKKKDLTVINYYGEKFVYDSADPDCNSQIVLTDGKNVVTFNNTEH